MMGEKSHAIKKIIITSSECPDPFVHSIDPWDRHDDRDIRWKDTTH